MHDVLTTLYRVTVAAQGVFALTTTARPIHPRQYLRMPNKQGGAPNTQDRAMYPFETATFRATRLSPPELRQNLGLPLGQGRRLGAALPDNEDNEQKKKLLPTSAQTNRKLSRTDHDWVPLVAAAACVASSFPVSLKTRLLNFSSSQ